MDKHPPISRTTRYYCLLLGSRFKLTISDVGYDCDVPESPPDSLSRQKTSLSLPKTCRAATTEMMASVSMAMTALPRTFSSSQLVPCTVPAANTHMLLRPLLPGWRGILDCSYGCACVLYGQRLAADNHKCLVAACGCSCVRAVSWAFVHGS